MDKWPLKGLAIRAIHDCPSEFPIGEYEKAGMRINFPARQTFRSGDYERLHAKVGFHQPFAGISARSRYSRNCGVTACKLDG